MKFKVGDKVIGKRGPCLGGTYTVVDIKPATRYPIRLSRPGSTQGDLPALESELELVGETASTPTGGIKYDDGKPDPTFLSWEMVQGVARVRAFGAKKYSRNNWKRGIGVLRNCGAILRHTFQFLSGETNDPESGECHLLHVICSAEQAYYDLIKHPELDDRDVSK